MKYLLLMLLCLLGFKGYSNGNAASDKLNFNIYNYAMEHVANSYEWHISSVNNIEVSVYLPILVYTQRTGFECFSSYRVRHQKHYKGFFVAHSGKHAGKLLFIDPVTQSEVRPLDFSLNKVVCATAVIMLLLLLLGFGALRYAQIYGYKRAPKGVHNVVELLLAFVQNGIAKDAMSYVNVVRFTPLLLSVFFFILIANLAGLVPIFPFGVSVTSNIAVPLALSVVVFLTILLNAKVHFWKEIVNPHVPMFLRFPIPLMPVIELASLLAKPFVLMIRLFANILAGHLIVLSLIGLIFTFTQQFNISVGAGASVVAVLFSLFMNLVHIMVAFIQAYVFTLLSAIYIGNATN